MTNLTKNKETRQKTLHNVYIQFQYPRTKQHKDITFLRIFMTAEQHDIFEKAGIKFNWDPNISNTIVTRYHHRNKFLGCLFRTDDQFRDFFELNIQGKKVDIIFDITKPGNRNSTTDFHQFHIFDVKLVKVPSEDKNTNTKTTVKTTKTKDLF